MEAASRLALEHHQLDRHYERLRLHQEEMERRLLSSLATRGQQVPIVVVPLSSEPGRYRVIDGFRRLRALERLGEDTVWATSWELPEVEALLLSRGLRAASETAIEQGWLLAELGEGFGLSCEELSRRFDRSLSWVSRRLALVRVLPAAVQDAVRLGQIAPHAAMRHLVPLARAKPELCVELAAVVGRHRLTSRETGELVHRYRRSAAAERRRILEDPRLALRALEVLGSADLDHECGSSLLWLRDLESVALTAERLLSTMPALLPRQHREARAAITATQRALAALSEALGGADAEP